MMREGFYGGRGWSFYESRKMSDKCTEKETLRKGLGSLIQQKRGRLINAVRMFKVVKNGTQYKRTGEDLTH